ncbi:pyridoxal-dependent decarboxylase [Pelagibius sp.]|uniref:pyridoxal phosphate-dependent decarboxylase family protein n=1 Tax=Pelagibius sp. TaxID=1931238 RepID=UPI0026023BBC|nr:pyridoxal-dependent decarboxylase [Pelagibius sp.]
MDSEAFSRLLDRARDHAGDYLRTVRDRRVYPDDAALAGLQAFDGPLPQKGLDPHAMLDMLQRHGAPAAVATSGGRYFGFVNGGLHPPALAARWLADAWDQNAAFHVMSPVAAKLEEVCERWLAELLDLPEGTAAGLVGGTSTSLVCGFAAARNALLQRQGWDVAAKGLFGAPEITVVLGAQAHGAVYRALALLGLGRERVVTVPCDDQGRMRAHKLPALDDRTLLILAAGNVNSGAFDPFAPLCERAKAAGAWVHVDGAFGLWAAAAPSTRALCDGMARADSWSVDAHKTLNVPYDSGIVLCRDRRALVDALQTSGAYLEWSGQRESMLYTPDMSRRARGIDLWATLATLGRDGVADLIEQLCAGARQVAGLLRAEGFRILNDVVFNQVLVACDSAAETEATLKVLQSAGEIWCGGSQWDGKPVIRISVCGVETTPEDLARAAAAFVRARQDVAGVPA